MPPQASGNSTSMWEWGVGGGHPTPQSHRTVAHVRSGGYWPSQCLCHPQWSKASFRLFVVSLTHREHFTALFYRRGIKFGDAQESFKGQVYEQAAPSFTSCESLGRLEKSLCLCLQVCKVGIITDFPRSIRWNSVPIMSLPLSSMCCCSGLLG